MLKDLTQRERKTVVSYELAFDYDENGGARFPCDAEGVVMIERLHPEAVENLARCKAHPEKFVRYNEVVAVRRTFVEPARGTCDCGETVILENQYYGACQCTSCGRWYNLFGESILPPDQWGDDLYEYD